MHDATDDLDDIDFDMPRRSNKMVNLVATVGVIATLGLGYFSWQLKGENKLTKDQLERFQKSNEELALMAESGEKAKKRESELSLQLSKTNSEVESMRGKVAQYAEQNAEIEQQLKIYRELTIKLDKLKKTGKLTINYRRGRMVLEMPSAILFPSGVAELSREGKKTVRAVARVLRRIRSQRFLVAGHTDSIPIRNKHFSSNWALSSARSVAVTEALIKGGVPSRRLGAAGFAHTDPVAKNRREKGRQLNRRIEIMVEPNMKPFASLEKKLARLNMTDKADAAKLAQMAAK